MYNVSLTNKNPQVANAYSVANLKIIISVTHTAPLQEGSSSPAPVDV